MGLQILRKILNIIKDMGFDETREQTLLYGTICSFTKINQFEPNTLKKSAHDLDKEDEHLGLSRFCRIRIKIKKLDWLKLDYKGHQRLEFEFGKEIKVQWIAS